MRHLALSIPALLVLAACSGGERNRVEPERGVTPPGETACNPDFEYCDPIPGTAEPCTDSEFWPLVTESAIRPLKVHYSRTISEATAVEMIALLEESWDLQVDMFGFSAPLSDRSACGPDDDYDVFIWPGIGGAFVTIVSRNLVTPHRDYSTYMAFDPSGRNGRELLNTFMAHEFNHALQASDDWLEDPQHYEAGATFAESLVYPDDDDWVFELQDFQDNPNWSLFYDDLGTTWYIYAAAMYLHFLYDRHFPTEPGFYARIWRATRSVGVGRPDYIDALRDVLLSERGLTLEDTVVEFMQWRWFVGDQDDGAHFSLGARWPHQVAETPLDAASIPSSQPLGAMFYGANYFRVTNNTAASLTFSATVNTAESDVAWRLLDVANGDITAPITLAPDEFIVLVAVLTPTEEIWSGNLSFVERGASLEFVRFP